MFARIMQHVRSNFVGYVALLVALVISPTAAYATHLVVRSSDIVNGEVKNPDIGPNAVSTGKLGDGQVRLDDLSPAARPKLPAARLAETGTPPVLVDNTFTTVLELQLPRGSWALYAKGFMYVPGPSSITCDLRNGGQVLDRTSGVFNSDAAGVVNLPFALIRPIDLPAPATVSLQCNRFSGSGAVEDLKIMASQLR